VRDDLVAARVALINAQVAGQEYDNRMAAALAATAELAASRDSLRNRWDLAGPAHQRVYYFAGEVNSNSSLAAIDVISRWERLDIEDGLDDRPYRKVLCSPGGDVIHGFQLYSFLKGLSSRRRLTISASGICASMATIIHQAASDDCRIVEPGCSYLLHEVSGGVGGRLDTVTDTADWMRKLNQNMYNIFAERSSHSAEEIEEKVSRREKFLTPEEVIEWGLADRIEYMA
jgi:ATP-dependent protease ClpP protease subunit